jgi:hypothetical protein
MGEYRILAKPGRVSAIVAAVAQVLPDVPAERT